MVQMSKAYDLLLQDDEHAELSADALRAHEEATRVKNVKSIVLGDYEMETW